MTAIEIPASIELIEDGAFADCHSLTVITFEKNSNLKAIGNSAFVFRSVEQPKTIRNIQT